MVMVVVLGSESLGAIQNDGSVDSIGAEVISINDVDDALLVADNTIVVVDSDEEVFNDSNYVQKLNELAVAGTILVTESKDALRYLDESISYVFSTSPSIDCFYYNDETGVSHCLSIKSDNSDFIKSEIESWMTTLDSVQASDIDLPNNFYTACIFQDSEESTLGLTQIRTYYHYWNEDDPKFDYFFTYTEIQATAKAMPRMGNNVEYIHTECQLDNPTAGDQFLSETAPESTDNSTVTIVLEFPPSISISWEIDLTDVEITNTSDTFDGKVDIRHDYQSVLSNDDVVREATAGYVIYLDTDGPSQSDSYNAIETHTIGYKTDGIATMTGTHVLEYDVHVVAGPMNCGDNVTKLD